MQITESMMINTKLAAEQAITGGEIIKDIIINDVAAASKARMQEGENYYYGRHRILDMDFRQVSIGSETITNAGRSNYKLVHKFHKKLVDQKKDYIAARKILIKANGDSEVKNKELVSVLAKFLGKDFNRIIKHWIKEASNKGKSWMHPYYTKDGTLKYTVIPAQEIIPIYDTQYQKELIEVIRYYTMYVIIGNKQVLRKRVEVWDNKQVSFWMEDEDGNFFLDVTVEHPVLPHWYTYNTQNILEVKPNAWGKVPFIPLWNNEEGTTDLEEIKTLIDAYDLINSEFVNNIADVQEIIWTLIGYGGEEPSEIARKLRTYKILALSDTEGKIESKQVDIPVEARKTALQILEEKIYELGRGVRFTQDKLGGDPSGVTLKFLYNDLDSKAQDIITGLESALDEFTWFIVDHINRTNNKSYDYSTVEYIFNKSIISNDKEIIDNLANSSDMMTKSDRVAKHPYNNRDPETIIAELEKEEEDNMAKYNVGGGGTIDENV